jgi:hypothetical protein
MMTLTFPRVKLDYKLLTNKPLDLKKYFKYQQTLYVGKPRAKLLICHILNGTGDRYCMVCQSRNIL